MRALLERSKAARLAVALVSAACVLGLVHAAVAGDDAGFRRGTFLPDDIFGAFFGAPRPGQQASEEREPVLRPTLPPKHHGVRRIWAAAHGRPLRIAPQRSRTVAAVQKPRARVAAPVRRLANAAPAFRLIPPPTRPAVVSIFGDRTLRSGDAVMLADGVHVFRDDGFWPHRPRDFVKLQEVAGLDWHLRRTLAPFDRNPPTRWTAIMIPPA